MATPRSKRVPAASPALMRARALEWIAYTLVTLYVVAAIVIDLCAVFAHYVLTAGVVTVLTDLGEYVSMPTILGLAGMSAVKQIWGGVGYTDTTIPAAPGTMGGGTTDNTPESPPPQD